MKNFIRILAVLWLTLAVQPAQAQFIPGLLEADSAGDDSSEDTGKFARDQELEELILLLSNPDLVAELKQRLAAGDKFEKESEQFVSGFQKYFQGTLAVAEKRAGEIYHALSTLSRMSENLSIAVEGHMAATSFLKSVIYVIIFLFGGFGLEWLYWCYLSGTLKRLELSKPKTYGSVLHASFLRAVFLLGSIVIFAVGSLGLFVGFEWSGFIEHIVLSLLAGIIIMRFIMMGTVFILAPKVDALRLLPLDQGTAKNIYNWIILISGIGLIGYLIVDTLTRMGVAAPSILAVQIIAGLVFTASLIASIWQSDARSRREKISGVTLLKITSGAKFTPASSGGLGISGSLASGPQNLKVVLWSAIVLVGFILWLLNIGAVMLTLFILSLLLPVIRMSRVMVDHIFDRVEVQAITPEPASEQGTENGESLEQEEFPAASPPSHYELYRPIVDRLMRFMLVLIALLAIGMIWDVNSVLQSTSNTLSERLFEITIDVVFALLIAELLWTWAKTAIDHKIATFPPVLPGHRPGPEARMATLLPMIRKVLMITMIVMVALIILSSLGVNIGPILAGAGVAGIALGFGAQALVKDIVSGVFFLIDDAFRVGEYIEMGDLRGTVESVSIRSLRVRHHRGAIHTIPFGELKSLTNYSRDWVIMKLEFRVPFDTDIKLVKKLIKKVSAKLRANEDYGHHIIEPLKSQGVRRMEEFNMVIGVKFMAVPGEQWTIRRDAYQQIRDAFKANGIDFAHRSVKVEVVSDKPLSDKEKEAAVSAAQDSIEQQLPPKAAPDEP